MRTHVAISHAPIGYWLFYDVSVFVLSRQGQPLPNRMTHFAFRQSEIVPFPCQMLPFYRFGRMMMMMMCCVRR